MFSTGFPSASFLHIDGVVKSEQAVTAFQSLTGDPVRSKSSQQPLCVNGGQATARLHTCRLVSLSRTAMHSVLTLLMLRPSLLWRHV